LNIKTVCIVATAALTPGLTGCFPELVTARPKAKITVADDAGTPIPGALVTLNTYSGFPPHIEQTEYRADPNGKVAIKRDLKWVMQVMLPDGYVEYGWNLCVSGNGYKAVYIAKPKFKEPIHVTMTTSAAPSECHLSNFTGPEIVDWLPGVWIQVDGGDWELDRPAMKDIVEQIQANAELHAQYLGHTLRPWSEYLFQYQGRLTGTTRFVYIKALCQVPPDVNLRTTFYSAPGGGACNFEITYDVVRGRFDSFAMTAAN